MEASTKIQMEIEIPGTLPKQISLPIEVKKPVSYRIHKSVKHIQ